MEQSARERVVQLGVDDVTIEGELAAPPDAAGLVTLVNGQWGVRYASRETEVAATLRREGFATLLVELLTPEESTDRSKRFETESLADRLAGVADWLDHRRRFAELPRGLLGAGPGGATVLRAAERDPERVDAAVSVNGRLDLVDRPVGEVTTPSLLIVDGSRDHLLEAHREAWEQFDHDRHHQAVLRASGEDPSAVSVEIASLATAWFVAHLGVD